jgi:hypothetical protein
LNLKIYHFIYATVVHPCCHFLYIVVAKNCALLIAKNCALLFTDYNMLIDAMAVGTSAFHTTRAATGIAPSVRALTASGGYWNDKKICCPCLTSMWCSLCPSS